MPNTTATASTPVSQPVAGSVRTPVSRAVLAIAAGAMIARAPSSARTGPAGRRIAYETGTISATTEAGTSSDHTPETSRISAIAVRLAATAASSRLPSRTRSASSSSNGRSLRGS